MIRSASVALAAVAALSSPLLLGAESPVPERLLHARYIALGDDLGDRIVPAEQVIGDPWRVTPHEREALDEIRSRLEGWGRYVVVDRSRQAELMLVVRSGRRGTAGAGIGSGGGELSSSDDLLAVYDTGGAPSTPLWRAQVSEGLAGEIPLFEAFQAHVERAAARRKQQ